MILRIVKDNHLSLLVNTIHNTIHNSIKYRKIYLLAISNETILSVITEAIERQYQMQTVFFDTSQIVVKCCLYWMDWRMGIIILPVQATRMCH